MSSYNRVVIMGNLTRQPELRKTKAGAAVAELGLALNRVWMGEDGQRQEETTFIDVTVWGRAAENAALYLKKGRSVLIEGRLQMESWQDRESGKRRTRLKVVADLVQYLGANPALTSGDGSEVSADTNRRANGGAEPETGLPSAARRGPARERASEATVGSR